MEKDYLSSRTELLATLRSAPFGVLSSRERRLIERVLELGDTPISEIMLPADRIVYVDAAETLGPLTLDRLYRSGFTHFPVRDESEKLIGAFCTARLNNLSDRRDLRALDLVDQEIFYAREDYSLSATLDVFLRNDCFFLLIVDKYAKIVGLLTLSDFFAYLLGRACDDFDRDGDPLAVAKRRPAINLDAETPEPPRRRPLEPGWRRRG